MVDVTPKIDAEVSVDPVGCASTISDIESIKSPRRNAKAPLYKGVIKLSPGKYLVSQPIAEERGLKFVKKGPTSQTAWDNS